MLISSVLFSLHSRRAAYRIDLFTVSRDPLAGVSIGHQPISSDGLALSNRYAVIFAAALRGPSDLAEDLVGPPRPDLHYFSAFASAVHLSGF